MKKRGSFLTEHFGKIIWFVIILLVVISMIVLFGKELVGKLDQVKEALFLR